MRLIVFRILSLFNCAITKRTSYLYDHLCFPDEVTNFKIPFTSYKLLIFSKKNRFEELMSVSIDESELPQSNLEDWDPNSERASGLVKESAQDYRSVVNYQRYKNYLNNKKLVIQGAYNGRSFWRIQTMREIRKANPNAFKGKVMEVGAGTGLVSSSISKFNEVESVYCLDYDSFSVKNLMPIYHWALDADVNKITRVIGSYNTICRPDGFFDSIIAVGAMHHSEDLEKTMKECFRVLRPGGLFIISDYAFNDSLSRVEYDALMLKPVSEQDAKRISTGEVLEDYRTNQATSEHGRPLFIYQAAAFNAGFNVNSFVFDATLEDKSFLHRICKKVKADKLRFKQFKIEDQVKELGYDVYGNVNTFGFESRSIYPYYAKESPAFLELLFHGDSAGKPVYDNITLILQKPLNRSHNVKFGYPSGNKYSIQVSREI